MTFAADAYAEGICNTAAGSEIEVLVDTLRDTINSLETIEAQDTDEQEVLDELVGRWTELADTIEQRERANGETTTFREDT